jgi:hypothetical protein
MARRKKATPAAVGTAKDVQDLFPQGAPVDENGAAIEDEEISTETAERVGLDAESSRSLKEFREGIVNKANRSPRTRWHSDMAARYAQAQRVFPHAKVRIKQEKPQEDDNIEPRPLALLKDYSDLIRYIRDNHWNGQEAATYRWTVFDDRAPTWCQGYVNFNANENARSEDDMSRQPQYPPGYAPYGPPMPQYGQPPPHPMPPNYGAPPPGYGPQMPPGYMPQHQVPPPPAPPMPQPIPIVPSGIPQLDQVMMMLRDLTQQNATLMQQLAQRDHELHQLRVAQQHQQGYPYGYGYPGVPQPTAQNPAAPPEKPKTAFEQLSEVAATFRQVNQMHKSIRSEFATAEDNPIGTVHNDEDFPLKVKDIGMARYLATPDGQITAPLAANADKILGAIDTVFDKVGSLISRAADKKTEAGNAEVEAMREKVRLMGAATDIEARRLQIREYQRRFEGPAVPQEPPRVEPAQQPPQPTQRPQVPWQGFVPPEEPVAVAVSEPKPEPPPKQPEPEPVYAAES